MMTLPIIDSRPLTWLSSFVTRASSSAVVASEVSLEELHAARPVAARRTAAEMATMRVGGM